MEAHDTDIPHDDLTRDTAPRTYSSRDVARILGLDWGRSTTWNAVRRPFVRLDLWHDWGPGTHAVIPWAAVVAVAAYDALVGPPDARPALAGAARSARALHDALVAGRRPLFLVRWDDRTELFDDPRADTESIDFTRAVLDEGHVVQRVRLAPIYSKIAELDR